MERRKVQKTGGSTFIVSLPKKWVDGHGIQQGDALDVHADPSGPVTIYPVGTRPTSRKTMTLRLDASRPTSHAERQVIGAYLAGYQTLVVTTTDRFPADHKQRIRALAQTLIGIEIVEETQNSITLQDLLDPLDFNLTKAIERMHQLARTMVADALSALRDRESDLAEDVPRRDPEVDRLDWMIVKQFHLLSSNAQLAAKLELTPSEALHHLLVSHAIERIADHAARLAEILGEPGTEALPQVTREAVADYGDAILALLDRAFEAFRRADMNGSNETLSKCKRQAKTANKLLGMGKGQTAATQVSLALLVKSIERVRSYTMDIGEAAIDHHMLKAN